MKTCEIKVKYLYQIVNLNESLHTYIVEDFLFKPFRAYALKMSFVCEVCNKEFSKKNCLTRHRIIHTGEKPYICEVCNKEFSLKDSLERHLYVHSGKKPHDCEICYKGFS